MLDVHAEVDALMIPSPKFFMDHLVDRHPVHTDHLVPAIHQWVIRNSGR